MSVSALRGGRLPLFHHHHRNLPRLSSFTSSFRKPNNYYKKFTICARYAQAQDLFSSRRLQDSIENLPKLVEDIVQTSIDTGPWGVFRLAQGVQAFIGVGQEWRA